MDLFVTKQNEYSSDSESKQRADEKGAGLVEYACLSP